MQSWNILSFNPKTTDVDEHIDLINTLCDMVDQKEEAKKENLIETMPTMIQTHLIMCKDWDTVKYTAKSLEHIIMKCDPPTPAMPMMATGATVLGLYSHIAHLVDKEEGEIPQPFKSANRNKPEVEEILKENLKIKDKSHPKVKRWMRVIIMKALTIITTIPQIRVEAKDLIMVRVETNNLEDLHHEIEDKDLNIVNVSFRITTIRERHHNNGSTRKPYFQGNQMNTFRGRGWGPQQFRVCGRSRQNFQNNAGIYQYQYYRHDQQSEQYGPPCSLCGEFNHSPKYCYKGEHDINNIMEKMSINPHKSQHNNLYQEWGS